MESDAASPILFDSLPYYDNDLEENPSLREKVEKELAREPKPPAALHPRVPPPVELFKNNPLLQAELKRVEDHEPLPPLDSSRYQLPAPIDVTDEEWQKALDNAKAQLEHQRIRYVAWTHSLATWQF
jgi:pre-mRNA-splicing factor SPF27